VSTPFFAFKFDKMAVHSGELTLWVINRRAALPEARQLYPS
jgi:hypothetical protein